MKIAVAYMSNAESQAGVGIITDVALKASTVGQGTSLAPAGQDFL